MARYDYWPRYGMENFSLVMPFEETFDAVKSTVWMQNNWQHSMSFSAAYVIAIFGIKKFMEPRKPFKLDTPLFLWNLILAVFSIWGFSRMTPEWLWSWKDNSFQYSICVASYAQGVTGFWTEMFAMSKVAELIDTGFIVLRKKPLIFLHWFHHITVLMYTWHAYKDHTASGRWFIWMNYGVHSFMYSYYALRAAHVCVPKPLAMKITVLQILQMVMGVYIGISIYFIKLNKTSESRWGVSANQREHGILFRLLLFLLPALLHFFYNAYLKKNNRYMAAKKSANENGEMKENGSSAAEIPVEKSSETDVPLNGPLTRAKRRVVKAE